MTYKRFYKLFNRLPLHNGEMKERLVQQYTDGRTSSLRAMSAADLAAWLESRGGRAVPCETVRDGLDQALAAAGPQDAVCACGSLYMIGEARRLLGLC